MMLTPCGPSAVRIGGAGFAFPAGICSFTTALIRFAITVSFQLLRYDNLPGLDFFNLEEIQYDRCLTSEEGDQHGNFIAIHIDLAHRANKLGERTINDAHTLAFGETDFCFRLISFLRDLLENGFHFMFLQRDGTGTGTNKTCDARCVTNNIPGLVAHDHLYQYITGKDFALHCTPLPLLDFHLFLHWNNDAKDFVPHIHRGNTCFEMALDLIFVARIGVDREPFTLPILWIMQR